MLTGSGSSVASTPAVVKVSGSVHGGQQPVSGSTIQMYTVGTGGLKSASAAMLTSTVQTDANGNFSLTGKYNCSTLPATYVYLTATGGNPGTGTNAALTMMAALGPCSALTSNTFTNINEVTTVAAAYALGPFASDVAHIGAAGVNPVGLVNAFANANLLANTALGTAGGAAIPTGVTVPTTEINTLADILAACVNSAGGASSGCNSLFTATGASDTFSAALAIAKNPGAAAVTALYNMFPAQSPFQPTLSAQPNDFTVAVSSTAIGTLSTPYGIAIDASGNAWVTNESGATVTELAANGALMATQTATGLYGAQGLAIDRTGNVWVANTAGNSVIKMTVTGGAVTGTAAYTAGGVSAPAAIAIDSSGNAFVANFNGNSVTGLTSSGAALSGSPFTGNSKITAPTGVAVGPSGAVFVTTAQGGAVSLANNGGYLYSLSDGTLQGPAGLAIDSTSRLGVTGFTTGTSVGGALSQFASSGSALSGSPATTGLNSPAGIATDGTSLWVANDVTGGSLSQFAYGATTPTSPLAGYGSLNAPVGVAVDGSGSVWTTNSGSNTVTKFVGLAVPVLTPVSANAGPAAP